MKKIIKSTCNFIFNAATFVKEIIKSTCKFIFYAATFVLELIFLLLKNPQVILPAIGALIALIIWVACDVCKAIYNAASNLFDKMHTPNHEGSNLNTGHFNPSPSSNLRSTQAAYSHISNAAEAGANDQEVHHTDNKIDLVTPA